MPDTKKKPSVANQMWNWVTQNPRSGFKKHIGNATLQYDADNKRGPKRQGYLDRYYQTKDEGAPKILYKPKKSPEYYKARMSPAATEAANRRARALVKTFTNKKRK